MSPKGRPEGESAPKRVSAEGSPVSDVRGIYVHRFDVPPDAIERLHRGSLRLLRPGGWIFHSVNCGDHYAYADPKVHQLNYLQFTDRQWAFWNNRFLYQNRLRAHQLVGAARDRQTRQVFR